MNDASGARTTARPGLFQRLRDKITRVTGLGAVIELLALRQLDPALIEELETRLLLADAGVEATGRIIEGLKVRLAKQRITDPAAARACLLDVLVEILAPCARPLAIPRGGTPFLVLMVGVNGSGKTTTIGKLAQRLKREGYSLMLAAGDTYRAAAIEQLQAWGERNAVPVIAQQPGADSAAVVFDALQSARARGVNVVLADTAGRLHNQAGLMQELAKVVRVAGRVDPAAPHEKMLVLDASLGQNAVNQAVQFHDAIGLTGIALTKLDGGGKGGVLLNIASRLNVPFRFIALGEGIDDLEVFDAMQFAEALISE